jgi:hypothetical protein
MAIPVIPSDQFREKIERSEEKGHEVFEKEEEEEKDFKKKGPSRRLSKKEKRAKAALKKL